MRGTTQSAGGGQVYLLHFDRPPHRHARHCTGSTVDLGARLKLHRSGRAARLIAVLATAEIGWTLERRGVASDRCPSCRAQHTEEAGR